MTSDHATGAASPAPDADQAPATGTTDRTTDDHATDDHGQDDAGGGGVPGRIPAELEVSASVFGMPASVFASAQVELGEVVHDGAGGAEVRAPTLPEIYRAFAAALRELAPALEAEAEAYEREVAARAEIDTTDGSADGDEGRPSAQ